MFLSFLKRIARAKRIAFYVSLSFLKRIARAKRMAFYVSLVLKACYPIERDSRRSNPTIKLLYNMITD